MDTISFIKKEKALQFVILLFIILSLWWLFEQFTRSTNPEFESNFAHIYWVLAGSGTFIGRLAAKKWGGFKSVMGKAITFLTLGLLAQLFGQFTYSFYFFFLNQDVPYPSIGDIGFFGSIPLYLLGVFFLAKASGLNLGLKSFANKLQAIVVPLLMLAGAYYLFLQGYEFDWAQPLVVLLDFAYPLGQALYISLAILTYSLSRGILGGIMKDKVLFLLFALIVQFAADYTFLFQATRGTWYPGGINDYIYLVAYFAMSVGIIQLKIVFDLLNRGGK